MSELHAYAYESGYQDGLRTADTEREALTRRIDELCAEVEQLKGENAKLRQLCHETWRSCPVEEDECKKCPHYLGEDGDDWCDIPIQMAEMGIEVGA